MKCPICGREAVEKEIPLFEETVGIFCTDFDPTSFFSNGTKKIELAMQDKKLYVCTNEACQHEFEK